MMSRAKLTALVIDLLDHLEYGAHRMSAREQKLILNHLDHTLVLSLDPSDPGTEPLLVALTSPAPILEHLQVGVYRPGRPWTKVVPLPAHLLGNHAPSLRRLFLYGTVHFPWDSSFLTSLVRLAVEINPHE
ncbi:hypothetical protein BV25DRAFT_166200 [Artomyces pyxidatus]|uniref:Uncharacterized protein n=1 Tax=Artomyces pyxidatus TaxID=48021 RepID=A0ACB8SHA0_9AGAM|nr:hypothetical protein BV25DRAFT_166200 [Artomyces pyxidatus]